MSDRQKQLEVMWDAYQLGQGSADHTDRQVFYEVVGGYLDRIAELDAELASEKYIFCLAKKHRRELEAENTALRGLLIEAEKWPVWAKQTDNQTWIAKVRAVLTQPDLPEPGSKCP